jgi:DNA replication protein DnaC
MSPESLRMIGVPKGMVEADISDFDTFGDTTFEGVKDFVSEYIENLHVNFENCHGLYLYGANGTGKSFVASIIIKEAYRHRYSAYRMTFAEYLGHYTRVWDARGLDEKDEMKWELHKYRSAEFLALEEIGKEVDSSIVAPVLEDLFRYREDNGLPMIVCSNLQIKALREQYGESVYSLLKGNVTAVKIEGEDQRAKYFRRRVSRGED